MATLPTYTFQLVGALKGKTVDLGPNKEYKFKDGKMTIQCSHEDLKCHANVLKRYYSAKLVKEAPAAEDPGSEDPGSEDQKNTGKSKK